VKWYYNCIGWSTQQFEVLKITTELLQICSKNSTDKLVGVFDNLMSVVEVDNLETIVGVDKFFVRHHNSYRMERNVDVVGSGRRMSLIEYCNKRKANILPQHNATYCNTL